MPQNGLYQNPSVKIHNIQKTAMELKPQFIFVNLNICAWLNVNIARVFLCLLSCRLLAITDSKMDFAYLMHASGGGEGGTRVIVNELRQPEAFFCLHKAQTAWIGDAVPTVSFTLLEMCSIGFLIFPLCLLWCCQGDRVLDLHSAAEGADLPSRIALVPKPCTPRKM